ncbi:transcriptional regulator [Ligilactobacillus salitolerans]|uniref:Transcriptional regulator n=1 Tax=Ligilactobacillus salitolerans TaxID=1808352 RepID=A0A401ISW2_9LACO|nr:helix-turn-helix domain-containing protein [Ligilactobacillus salitolerans]GBG94597.1 transcriptional regulator [Ligilactobacillus salitolerans]
MSEIGQTLKKARVDKGLTLDDLQQTTKIQKRYLIAIEEEDFKALPGDFYVKAFIKEYAETVGLNADELLSSFGDQIETQDESPVHEEATSRMNLREKNAHPEGGNGQKILNYLPTIVIVVIVVAIIGTIFGVSYNNRHQAQKSVENDVQVSSDSSSTKKTAKKKAKDTSSSAKSSSTTKKKAKKTTKKKKQSLSLTGNSGTNYSYVMKNAPQSNKVALEISGGSAWSSVSADGTQTWQGTLSDGQDHTVTIPSGAGSITIQLGNSQATTLKLNGKKFDFLKDNSTLTVRSLTIQLGESSNTASDSTASSSNAGQSDTTAADNNGNTVSSSTGSSVSSQVTDSNQQ